MSSSGPAGSGCGGPRFANVLFWGYQAFLLIALSGYVPGITQSREYAEPEWYADLWLLVDRVTYLAIFVGTLACRREPHIPVANWFNLAFIITVAILHAAGRAAQAVWRTRLTDTPLDDIEHDDDLRRFAIANGRAAFNGTCAPCHGVGSGGEIRLGRAAFCGVAGTVGTASEIWLTQPGHAPARFAFEDPVRPESATVVATLRAKGLSSSISWASPSRRPCCSAPPAGRDGTAPEVVHTACDGIDMAASRTPEPSLAMPPICPPNGINLTIPPGGARPSETVKPTAHL